MRVAPIIVVIVLCVTGFILYEWSNLMPSQFLTQFNFSQLLTLAQAAGFPSGDDTIAAAVALAESDGNSAAYNPEDAAGAPFGKGSFGLWQIYLHAHPEFEGQNLNDPTTNANAAFSVYQAAGNSFRPWSAFKSGKYLAFVSSGSNSQMS